MTTTGTTGYLLQASTLWLVFAAVDSQCNGKTLEMAATMDFQALQSPNHPRNYPNNARCSWLLVAPSDEYRIKLHTYVLDLEWFPSCAYDNISIYDGYNESSQLLVTFCANFHIIASTQRYMYVVFVSDKSSSGAGFDLRYNAQLINPPSTLVLTTTTTEDTTAANKGDSGRVNTWILIGSIVGGICVIVIIGIVCGRCMSSRRTRHHRRPPPYRAAAFYHSHSPLEARPSSAEDGPPAMPASVHMVQNNNAVFMVSGTTPGQTLTPSHFASMTSGVANLAFSGSTEYMAMNPTQGYLGPPIGVPPPSYTETMLMTHPPVIPPSPSRSYAGMHPNVSPTPSLGLSVPGSLGVPSGRPLNSSSAFTVLPNMSTPNIIIHTNGAQMHPHMDANLNGHVACLHSGQLLPPPLSEDYTTHNSSGTCLHPPIPQSVVAANPYTFPPSENPLITRYFPSAASTSMGSVPYNYAPQGGAISGLFPPVVCQELQTTPAENQLSQPLVSSSGDLETNPESYSTVEEIHQNLDSTMQVAMETERPLTTSCAFSVQHNEQSSEHRPFADQRARRKHVTSVTYKLSWALSAVKVPSALPLPSFRWIPVSVFSPSEHQMTDSLVHR
ncbi:uncharacterized protein LOC112571200 [Pomacea canaliculata]|uniref:uncharacterized protein LOC112571200 n=1 Tax=Pomacea canaliculata TaxID=400727 RepID=UPI000D7370FB|nr:uncharacterized protein LOC112571200 [Pomacea canaliculata]